MSSQCRLCVSAYAAEMYNLVTSSEDPSLSLADHENMGDGEDEGTLWKHWLSMYGMNVFIRNSVNCTEAVIPS